jgi:hypothetical protein
MTRGRECGLTAPITGSGGEGRVTVNPQWHSNVFSGSTHKVSKIRRLAMTAPPSPKGVAEGTIARLGYLMQEHGARALVHVLHHVTESIGDSKSLLTNGRIDAFHQGRILRDFGIAVGKTPFVNMPS